MKNGGNFASKIILGGILCCAMSKINRVIIDYDECLAIYRKGFLAVHPEYAGIFVFPKDLNLAFRQSDGLKYLEAMPGAVEFVKAMNAARIPVDILTSLGDEPAAIKNREYNIEYLFGRKAFDNVHFLPYRVHKDEALEGLGYNPETTAFVDDFVPNFVGSPYINIWWRVEYFGDPEGVPEPTPEILSWVKKEVLSLQEAIDFILKYE